MKQAKLRELLNDNKKLLSTKRDFLLGKTPGEEGRSKIGILIGIVVILGLAILIATQFVGEKETSQTPEQITDEQAPEEEQPEEIEEAPPEEIPPDIQQMLSFLATTDTTNKIVACYDIKTKSPEEYEKYFEEHCEVMSEIGGPCKTKRNCKDANAWCKISGEEEIGICQEINENILGKECKSGVSYTKGINECDGLICNEAIRNSVGNPTCQLPQEEEIGLCALDYHCKDDLTCNTEIKEESQDLDSPYGTCQKSKGEGSGCVPQKNIIEEIRDSETKELILKKVTGNPQCGQNLICNYYSDTCEKLGGTNKVCAGDTDCDQEKGFSCNKVMKTKEQEQDLEKSYLDGGTCQLPQPEEGQCKRDKDCKNKLRCHPYLNICLSGTDKQPCQRPDPGYKKGFDCVDNLQCTNLFQIETNCADNFKCDADSFPMEAESYFFPTCVPLGKRDDLCGKLCRKGAFCREVILCDEESGFFCNEAFKQEFTIKAGGKYTLGKCMRSTGQDTPCSSDDNCEGSLACLNNKCQLPNLVGEGESCRDKEVRCDKSRGLICLEILDYKCGKPRKKNEKGSSGDCEEGLLHIKFENFCIVKDGDIGDKCYSGVMGVGTEGCKDVLFCAGSADDEDGTSTCQLVDFLGKSCSANDIVDFCEQEEPLSRLQLQKKLYPNAFSKWKCTDWGNCKIQGSCVEGKCILQ
ncbi:hypothetical protein ACFL0W_01815 [Nanoarchaeota archaeon]